MQRCWRYIIGTIAGVAAWTAAPAAADVPGFSTYQTHYYVLHTDLDQQGVQEATVRITLMFEEYQRRTKGLAGTVNKRMPFYLFKHMRDYVAAGGIPGSAGVFTGEALMAVANPEHPEAPWSVVQHEGFHQFVDAAIGHKIPIWANEGMAEYFGVGQFTGDQFIVGLIPPERLERVKQGIRQHAFRPLRDMLILKHDEWNSDLRHENYDQAWAMVQFLAHGDNGKYEQPFMSFLREVARKTPWERAWVQAFGTDVNAFQKRWEEYWTGLPDNPTGELYAEVVVLTLTSFYGRTQAQRQRFEMADEFFAAAAAGKLSISQQDWLPPSLLKSMLAVAPQVGQWTLEGKGNQRFLTCARADGSVLQGRFQFDGGKVRNVHVEPLKKRK